MGRGRREKRRDAAPEDWAVVCVLREPPGQVRRFVAYHLEAGASRVHLIFDDPFDPALDVVAGMGRVEATRAAPRFWAELGLDPAIRFTKRQNAALTWAYHRAREPWLAVVDADEGVHVPGGLGAALGTLDPSVGSVRLAPAEAVAVPGPEETFRRAVRSGAARRVHGEAAALFGRNHGLVGHSAGKSVYRTGQGGLVLRQHWANGQHAPVHRMPGAEGCLLHWVGRGWEAWRAKLEWRLAGHGFRPTLRGVLRPLVEAGDEAGLRAAHEALHTLDADQVALMDEIGALVRPGIDWDGILARHFPEDAPRACAPPPEPVGASSPDPSGHHVRDGGSARAGNSCPRRETGYDPRRDASRGDAAIPSDFEPPQGGD
ncbi:glycosyl transferase family 2 [Hasllibacter halocynthiae]|uniref:Glycosyl transferase family 2 n=1 Tax=Hasllibacter halocynthiae TaxID=595589 RepID=A0A2T0X3E0_9RHOB|nr:glycosyltransferase family 2 protein [Hasllibacter halocynthiae]PRY93463.1 glycosyl transferase family 2 [Hasllibacter halocynthiae]